MSFSFTKGRLGEDFVYTILTDIGLTCEYNEDYSKRYDYDLISKIGKKKFTLEVKFDQMSDRTGNIAIEYRNSRQDKPSGIYITKADLWVQVLESSRELTAWFANVKSLKAHLDEYQPFKTVEFGGDANAAIFLYKKEDILSKVFTQIDGEDMKKSKQIIRKLLK